MNSRNLPPSATDQRSHAAFTLVELLVVIAIIAVLVSLLLPVLSTMKRTSNNAHCVSSLRLLAQAHTAFAADHDGWYIPAVVYTNSSGEYEPREGDPPGDIMANTPGWNGAWYKSQLTKDYLGVANWGECDCPEAAKWRERFNRDNNASSLTTCYAYNIEGVEGQRRYRATSAARISGSESGSQKIAFLDALNWAATQRYSDPTAYYEEGEYASTYASLAYRHSGKLNAVFYDGHVESFTPEELMGPENTHLWSLK